MTLEQLTGAALADLIALHRNASGNWARLTDGPQDAYLARVALLDRIADNGSVSDQPPAWMTSPKPGVDAYLHVDGVVVLLRQEEMKGRPWHGFNTIAARRGRANITTATSGTSTKSSTWTPEQIAQLQTLAAESVAELTGISAHCVDRTRDRGLYPPHTTDQEVRELLLASIAKGVQVGDLPKWANAAGVGGLALLIDDSAVVLPVQPDHRHEHSLAMIATTCMPYQWVKDTLLEPTIAELLPNLTISSACLAVDQSEDELRGRLAADGQIVLSAQGAYILLREQQFKLRPAAGAGWNLTI